MEGFLVVMGIVVGLITLWIITRPFTILFHELGHAIPMLLFTKQPVTIFICSYGDKKQSFKINIGKLEIWFKYNVLKWRGGLCIPKSKNHTQTQRIIWLLTGPLFSLLISTILFFMVIKYDMHGSLKLICSFALGSSILDLIVNLIPQVITTKEGEVLYSDGYSLLHLIRLKRYSKEYTNTVEKYNNGEYVKAATSFEDFINKKFADENTYRLLISSHLLTKNYKRAFEIQKEFESKFVLTSDDYYNIAYSRMLLKSDNIDFYLSRSLEINPDNCYSLNAVGYYHNTKEEFEKAILVLDKAIQINNDFAFAYNNRGHAKIEIGDYKEGLLDIKHSISLDKNNSYAYRNLGIYHLKKNNKETALKYLLQAKEMDNETELIDEYINKVTVS